MGHQDHLGEAEAPPHSVYSCPESASGVRHGQSLVPSSSHWLTFHTGPLGL